MAPSRSLRGQRPSLVRFLLLIALPRVARVKLVYMSDDSLVFTNVKTTAVDATGAAAEVMQDPEAEEPSSKLSEVPSEMPRGSLKATLRRIGARLPPAEDETSLREALEHALRKEKKMALLRGLLFERGGQCIGCSERREFIEAVMTSLGKPLVGRHALPLFLHDAPLMPHTEMSLHLYEPRYKLLCRKALKTVDRLFGFASGTIGTLAKIKDWRFSDDDATHGTCHVTVTGLRRFKLGRQWQDTCTGCSSGPLHYADVTYFNDTETREGRLSKGVALVKEALRLHHALVDVSAQRDLERQIGPTPTVRDRGFAMSFWLSAACAVLDERCKARALELLASTSTADRVEQVLRVTRSLAGKRFSSSK